MKYLELTFPDPASNLACDEALIEVLETTQSDGGIFRLWEPNNYFVVLGCANKILAEVDTEACEMRGVPVLRRSSGGGAVLQGPGCLNYALVLPNDRGVFESVRSSYRFILERHQRCLESLLGAPVQIQGTSDLAADGRKFSGNAQNRRRRFVLFHGTLLLNLDLSLVEICLRMPSKQPQYRERRAHRDFLMNIHLARKEVSERLKRVWGAEDEFVDVPSARVQELVRERYGRPDWTFRF